MDISDTHTQDRFQHIAIHRTGCNCDNKKWGCNRVGCLSSKSLLRRYQSDNKKTGL
nr:MAG TPA: hypothetical protein [Caudoviricetes sp.]